MGKPCALRILTIFWNAGWRRPQGTLRFGRSGEFPAPLRVRESMAGDIGGPGTAMLRRFGLPKNRKPMNTTMALEREPIQRRRWGQMVARAWDDEDFRQRLVAEPEALLREEGFDLPEGIEVRIGEEEEQDLPEGMVHLRLPARPSADDLIEDGLSLPEEWQGPFNACSCFCSSCYGCQCPCKHCKKCTHKCKNGATRPK